MGRDSAQRRPKGFLSGLVTGQQACLLYYFACGDQDNLIMHSSMFFKNPHVMSILWGAIAECQTALDIRGQLHKLRRLKKLMTNF